MMIIWGEYIVADGVVKSEVPFIIDNADKKFIDEISINDICSTIFSYKKHGKIYYTSIICMMIVKRIETDQAVINSIIDGYNKDKSKMPIPIFSKMNINKSSLFNIGVKFKDFLSSN